MVGLKTLVNRKCSKMGSHHITLNIANKMTSGDFTIANYFKNKKKIFLSPTTTEENEDVIKTFNLNKAIGADSIAVNAKQI